jgi:16S rRNA (guanine527-N7)-methyltransferase
LISVFEEARRRGFLGPGPVEAHIVHARAFGLHCAVEGDERCLDLGSGGGVPGLVLAYERPGPTWVLLDASAARATFLSAAITELGMAERVTALAGRAEEVGRDPFHRGAYDLVVARAFARPAVVAECAAPLLKVGGVLLVSEPPDQRGRWPADGLERLGLAATRAVRSTPRIACFSQEWQSPEQFPRRVGIPSKRPLW